MAKRSNTLGETQTQSTADYIASLASSLARLANQAKLPFLEYLLQMAVEESRNSASGERGVGQAAE